jgi:hypothetical protein
MARFLYSGLCFILAVFRASVCHADGSPLQTDPAAPAFFEKPGGLRQPVPARHPRGACFGKPRPLVPAARASDWPGFLGPTQDGVSPETSLACGLGLPPDGGAYPNPLWSVSKGESYSAPSVKDGRLILFHRLRTNEVVECLDAETGGLCWSFAYPTTYRDRYR